VIDHLQDVLAALKLDDGDRARLVALHGKIAGELPAIAQLFYDELNANPKAAAVSTSAAQKIRLRGTLVDWMAAGLLGPYDAAFGQARARIGQRHVAIGLPQHLMFTSMNLIRTEYHRCIDASYDAGEAALVSRSADKLLDMELALMLRHYQLDSESRLVERERRIQSDRVVAIQTLSAGLAHEVRNPLNSAKLQLELLERRLRKDGDDPKLVEPVELAGHEIARLTQLLNEFLAFARPPDLHLGEHDVIAIAREVVELERPLAADRGATLELVTDSSVSARLDSAKLHQIIQNLVRNGIEAVRAGGVVTVSVRDDHDHVLIRVEDNGPGIPDAVRSRIYEPFFSTKESGTGLGMSIVHSMVTLHNGTIEIDSGPTGTRFDIALPKRA